MFARRSRRSPLAVSKSSLCVNVPWADSTSGVRSRPSLYVSVHLRGKRLRRKFLRNARSEPRSVQAFFPCRPSGLRRRLSATTALTSPGPIGAATVAIQCASSASKSFITEQPCAWFSSATRPPDSEGENQQFAMHRLRTSTFAGPFTGRPAPAVGLRLAVVRSLGFSPNRLDSRSR
jgi:hypothetical protein